MKGIIRVFGGLALCCAVFAACTMEPVNRQNEPGKPPQNGSNENNGNNGGNDTNGNDSGGDTQTPDIPSNPDIPAIPENPDYPADAIITIHFSGNSPQITNPFAGKGVDISVTGNHVVVNSAITNTELNYVLSGTAANGSVKWYGKYKFGLTLNGVNLTNPNGAAINIQCGKKISVFLADGTANSLADGVSYNTVSGEDMKGTFFSEGQLLFSGGGSLEISSKYKHALVSDDYIAVYSGAITVKEAEGDGIHANDEINISGGTITVNAAGDGLESEKGSVLVSGGTFNIVTTGATGHGIKGAVGVQFLGSPVVTVTVSGNGSKCVNSAADILVSGGTFTLNNNSPAFYDAAKADITTSAAFKSDGIFQMDGGTVVIKATGSGGKGISADGDLTINGGSLEVTTSGGQYKYSSKLDTAAKAVKSDGNVTINNGTIKIKTSGVEAEGIESKKTLTINGGLIEVEAYDDGINAANHIQINGGTIYSYSTTNDGIDSNGTMTITGGMVFSSGSNSPEEGFDCDNNTFKITGGLLVGLGGATSNPTASVCTQNALVYNTTSASSLASGTLLHIEKTSGGGELLTVKMPRTYSSRVCLLFSSADLAQGIGYTVYYGGSVSGGDNFRGLYTGAAYTKGTQLGTFTSSSSSRLTTEGSSGGMGPGRP